MGVYIKGMKMPKSCSRCFMLGHECPESVKFPHIKLTEYRFKGCPLVEVPEPHGDLIDREEMIVNVYEDADGFHYEVSAPTVIEAEGNENE